MSRAIKPAWRVEWLKARRSRVPLVCGAALTLGPIMAAVFMLILKTPGRVESLGTLGQKAQMMTMSADWKGFLAILTQASAVGGWVVQGFLAAWLFGREYAEDTYKNLLALPVRRESIVAAKYTVLGAMVLLINAWIAGIGVLLGTALDLPGWDPALLNTFVPVMIKVTVLNWLLLASIAWAASAGKGYLTGLGMVFLTLFLSQVLGALGYGSWFPWAVPTLLTGVAGPATSELSTLQVLTVPSVALIFFLATTCSWRQGA